MAISTQYFFFFPTSEVAYADELNEVVDETIDGLDLSGFQTWLNDLSASNGALSGDVKEMIKRVLSGENEFDFSFILSLIIQLFFGEMKSYIPTFSILLGVCFLYGLLKNATFGLKKADVGKIVYLVCFGIVITLLTVIVTKTVVDVNETVMTFESISTGCFPVLVTIVAAMGGTASASVFQPMVVVFGGVLVKLVQIVVMPMFYVTFIFGLVGNISENFSLDKMAKGVKSACTWLVTVVFGLFTTLLAAEGVVGAGVDGMAARGIKVALSGSVPVIGGYLKDGFDVVVAGCVAVKDALGLCAVIFLLFTVAVPVIKIAFLSVALKLSAGVLEPVSDAKFCKVLSLSAESMKILLLAVISLFVAALIFLMTVLFICNPGLS